MEEEIKEAGRGEGGKREEEVEDEVNRGDRSKWQELFFPLLHFF